MVGFVRGRATEVAAELVLPPGYRLTWGGQFENQQRAAARLIDRRAGRDRDDLRVCCSRPSARSRQALLVLVNIPFAMIGGMFALVV